MRKIVFSSFENTLIDEEEAINVKTMFEIEKLRKEKNIFVIMTCQSVECILEYAKDFPFVDYIIALNGAEIYDVTKQKIIAKQKMTLAKVKKILNNYEDNIFIETELKTLSKETYLEQDNLDTLAIKIYFEDEKQLNENYKKLKECGLKINIEKMAYYNDYYLIINSSKTDKLKYIDKVINKYKENSNYYVLGNMADIDVAKRNNVFIVKNASKELKNSRIQQLNHSDSLGVYEALKMINN